LASRWSCRPMRPCIAPSNQTRSRSCDRSHPGGKTRPH
jgi:hypothetical protein